MVIQLKLGIMSKFVSNITLFILTAVIILLPIDAVAQTTTPYIGLNKTANYDYTTHTGIITLDSFVTGSVREIRTAIAADIILVLDYSSSMSYSADSKTRGELVQLAACNFVDQMASSAVTNSVDHKMSIVTFGSGAHIRADNLSVKDNVSALKAIINEPNPATGEEQTRYDLAMLLVKNLIEGGYQYSDIGTNGNASKPNNNYNSYYHDPELVLSDTYCTKSTLSTRPSDDQPIIVFLTDGEPTGKTVMGYLNSNVYSRDLPGNSEYLSGSTTLNDNYRYGSAWQSGDNTYEFGIANYAIRTAKYLKTTKNALIYSIKISKVGNSYKNNLAIDALTAICSKYPNAERYRQNWWGAAASGDETYFQNIETVNQASISGAFSNVSSSVEQVVSIQYGAETIMNDFINNTYFKLTDAVNPSDPWSSINVYKVRCTGIDSDGSTRTFGTAASDTTQLHASDGINITINKATSSSENDQILVSGFNYSENWCGIYNSSPHGYKLVVKVPFEFTGGVDTPVPGTVNTNSAGSGIYPAQKNDDGTIKTDTSGQPIYDSTPEEVYISPTIDFCTMLITRVGLDPDESAVYEVTCDNKFVARVALNGTEASSVSKYLYGLPGGNYTVTETGWNWAYDKKIWDGSSMVAGNVLTKTVDTPNTPIEFKFGGAHKTGTGPEDLHNHDEKYKVNRINVSDL